MIGNSHNRCRSVSGGTDSLLCPGCAMGRSGRRPSGTQSGTQSPSAVLYIRYSFIEDRKQAQPVLSVLLTWQYYIIYSARLGECDDLIMMTHLHFRGAATRHWHDGLRVDTGPALAAWLFHRRRGRGTCNILPRSSCRLVYIDYIIFQSPGGTVIYPSHLLG